MLLQFLQMLMMIAAICNYCFSCVSRVKVSLFVWMLLGAHSEISLIREVYHQSVLLVSQVRGGLLAILDFLVLFVSI